MPLSAWKCLKIYRLLLWCLGCFAAWLGRACASRCASTCARPTARPTPGGEKVLACLVGNHRRPFVQDFFPTAIYTPSPLSASILGWDGNRRVRSHFSPPGHVTPLPCLTAAGDPAAAAAQIAASFLASWALCPLLGAGEGLARPWWPRALPGHCPGFQWAYRPVTAARGRPRPRLAASAAALAAVSCHVSGPGVAAWGLPGPVRRPFGRLDAATYPPAENEKLRGVADSNGCRTFPAWSRICARGPSWA